MDMARTSDCLDWAETRITIRPVGAGIQNHKVRVGILDLLVGAKNLDRSVRARILDPPDPKSLNDQNSIFDINRIWICLILFINFFLKKTKN